jgi:hypothetical protein
MRNYAEATKAAARKCPAANVTVDYVPSDSAFHVRGAGDVCPTVGDVRLLRLTVTGPLGFEDTMDVKVRTP